MRNKLIPRRGTNEGRVPQQGSPELANGTATLVKSWVSEVTGDLQVTKFPCWSEKQVAEGDTHLLLGLKNSGVACGLSALSLKPLAHGGKFWKGRKLVKNAGQG